MQGEVAAACGEGCETQQRAEKSDQVDGNGEAREIEEEKLEELKPLSKVEAVEVAPNDEAGRVERPGAALLVEVGYVVRRVLRHSAHDRQIKATPPAPKCLDARLQVLDEIPGWEVADLCQGRIPPDHA